MAPARMRAASTFCLSTLHPNSPNRFSCFPAPPNSSTPQPLLAKKFLPIKMLKWNEHLASTKVAKPLRQAETLPSRQLVMLIKHECNDKQVTTQKYLEAPHMPAENANCHHTHNPWTTRSMLHSAVGTHGKKSPAAAPVAEACSATASARSAVSPEATVKCESQKAEVTLQQCETSRKRRRGNSANRCANKMSSMALQQQ